MNLLLGNIYKGLIVNKPFNTFIKTNDRILVMESNLSQTIITKSSSFN